MFRGGSSVKVSAAAVAVALSIVGCTMQSGVSYVEPTPSGTSSPLTFLGLCLNADDAELIHHTGDVDAGVAISGDGPTGIVISYEQNGSVCDWMRLRDRLVESGYTVLQYERFEGDTLAYVPEMVNLLRDRGIEQVALIGGSIGGMVSIIAASRIMPPVAAVVSLSGASVDTVAAAGDLRVPLLQVVAEGDTQFVAPSHSTDDAATHSPDHQLVIREGSAHASILFSTDREVADLVDQFLINHLPPT